MKWHTQAGNINTNIKVKVYFALPALSTTNSMTLKCHVDDSAKGVVPAPDGTIYLVDINGTLN